MRSLSIQQEGNGERETEKAIFLVVIIERFEMGFLMKPSGLENGCRRSN
jgi:hypothetical protein